MERITVPRRLVLISLLAMAMIVVPAVTSLPSGISGVKDTGCNCHGTEASPSVTESQGFLKPTTPRRPML